MISKGFFFVGFEILNSHYLIWSNRAEKFLWTLLKFCRLFSCCPSKIEQLEFTWVIFHVIVIEVQRQQNEEKKTNYKFVHETIIVFPVRLWHLLAPFGVKAQVVLAIRRMRKICYGIKREKQLPLFFGEKYEKTYSENLLDEKNFFLRISFSSKQKKKLLAKT